MDKNRPTGLVQPLTDKERAQVWHFWLRFILWATLLGPVLMLCGCLLFFYLIAGN